MGPAYYILAILGCGEGEASCQQVATAPTQYASEADCQSASEDALMRHVDADYPVVVAQCRQAGQKLAAQLWANDVSLPQPELAPTMQPRQADFKGQRLARR